MKRHRLKNLSLKELSVVDRPANQHAMQLLRKRHEQRQGRIARLIKSITGADQGLVEEQVDDVAVMSDALAVSVADCIEKCETPEELEEALSTTLDQFKAHVVKAAACDDDMDEEDLEEGQTGSQVPPGKGAKKPAKKDDGDEDEEGDSEYVTMRQPRKKSDAGTDTGEPNNQEHTVNKQERAAILKGLSPDALAYIEKLERENAASRESVTKAEETANKAIEAANAAVEAANVVTKRMEEQSQRAHVETLIKSANIPLEDALSMYKGALLLKAAGDEKAVERCEALFKRQATLIEKSGLFEETGEEGDSGEGSAYDALQKRAAEILSEVRKSGGKRITPQQAFVKACEENAELYEQYLDENPAQAARV